MYQNKSKTGLCEVTENVESEQAVYGMRRAMESEEEPVYSEEEKYEEEDVVEGLSEEAEDAESEQAVYGMRRAVESEEAPVYTPENENEQSKEEALETMRKEVEALISPAERDFNRSLGNDSTYEKARMLIDMYKLCCFDSVNASGIVWRFGGKSYIPLGKKDLEQLVYDSLSEEKKQKENNIQPYIKQVAEYIRRELFSEVGREKYYFGEEDFQKIRNYMVFQNGVYDIVSGRLLPFSDELPHYLEVNAVFKRETEIPVYYNKLKVYATGGVKETIEMLDVITAVLFLQRQLKYIFVAGNASNSGKSKYIEFLERLMPSQRVCRLAPSDLDSKFALGEADKVTLFSCADIETNVVSTKAVSILKRLAGETFVRGEAKFCQARDIRILGKIIMGTNDGFCPKKPDQGIINRLIALPFVNEVKPEDRDECLLDKIWLERDDIMTLCAMKLHDLVVREGEVIIPVSEQSENLKQSWIFCENFVKAFLEEELVITGEKNDNFSVKELHKMYQQFYCNCVTQYKDGTCRMLGETEVFNELKRLSNGVIRKERVSHIEGKRLPNSIYRVCGLKKRQK